MWPPPKKKKKKENPLWCFFKVTAFYSLGYRKIPGKRRYRYVSTLWRADGKGFNMKRAKVDHVYQHVIKTEDVLLLSLLEHYIIECTRILRNNYSGCFFFYKKTNKTKRTTIPKQTNQKLTSPPQCRFVTMDIFNMLKGMLASLMIY